MIKESRAVSYSILLGVWGLVAVYAVLHDQYIVRISPEHFTVYHDPVPGIENPELLAFLYALGASVSPGLALGFACLVVGRSGGKPKIPVKYILIGAAAVIICTELVSAALGYYAYRSGKLVFPEFLYPDPYESILVTQTIQLSAYLCSAMFSAVLLAVLFLKRRSS